MTAAHDHEDAADRGRDLQRLRERLAGVLEHIGSEQLRQPVGSLDGADATCNASFVGMDGRGRRYARARAAASARLTNLARRPRGQF
jgi:hypothetical protein